ncbi:amidohydrolase family protein [Bradyrhizobium sp. NP1]|uniref:amidohydrolase family protein n=1 Tax=Bradyrhizobium sp. NP1 TaxID=3049772 RepID=UPI0025A52FC8|nr:amidohydrolase family protein [Bradyrhizobium sp. NP1]WJR76714.1 amidohydrolase family protein [Bradyrhizobium sp. NP1]
MSARDGLPRCSVLIKGVDWAVTVNASREIVKSASIAVDRDRIVAIGKSEDLDHSIEAEKTIDGRGLLALPGIVDCCVNSSHHLGRGLADACDMYEYHLGRRLPYEAALSPEDAFAASLLSQVEMVHAGTTCFVDAGSRFYGQVAGAAASLGIRAFVSRSCSDVTDTFFGEAPIGATDCVEEIENAQRAVLEIQALGSSRVRPALALPWLPACSDDLCRGMARLAATTGAITLAGAAFCRDDAVASRREHFRTEVERLDAAGLLGDRLLISNAGWSSPTDMVRLRDAAAHVVCTPSASHRLGTGSLEYGRYPELVAFGVNVLLGSFSAMASNHTDLLRQLFLFCGGSMSFRLDATITPPELALEMATIRAAKALGIDKEIGSLEAGKKADIALFGVNQSDWVPLHDPLANLAFSTRGGADTVLVDGRILLERGKLTSMDEGALLQEGQARASAVAERSKLSRHSQPRWRVV